MRANNSSDVYRTNDNVYFLLNSNVNYWGAKPKKEEQPIEDKKIAKDYLKDQWRKYVKLRSSKNKNDRDNYSKNNYFRNNKKITSENVQEKHSTQRHVYILVSNTEKAKQTRLLIPPNG